MLIIGLSVWFNCAIHIDSDLNVEVFIQAIAFYIFEYNVMQCDTMQYNVIRRNTMQYNAAQYKKLMTFDTKRCPLQYTAH